jgi:hypothetical protein
MHTKTITQDIDWLNAIDGRTVAEAIGYLSTLNPEHVLNYNLEGNTYGCRVESDVSYEVPMTNKEILEKLEVKYLKEIAFYVGAKQKRIKTASVENYDLHIARAQKLLDEARAKYGSVA